jgi:hypothetical protein
MTDDIQKLSKVLDELIQLLEVSGEKHWTRWMLEAKDNLSNDYGVGHILAAYGGMGSFSDLIIYRKAENGRLKWSLSDRMRNDKLDKLRKQVWELADGIRRSRMISDSWG